MTYIERVNTLHPDIINNFLEVGESSAIPVELQHYILQISWANEIWQTERNITRAARKLRQRVLSQGMRITERNCRERINDALNFFTVDSNVSQEAWDLHTADRLTDYGRLAALKYDFKTAIQAEKDANLYRQRASSNQNTGSKKIVFLLSKDIKAEDLGFQDKSMKEIAKKHNDGFYFKLINKLPIDNKEKKKLFDDAELTDYEEVAE